MSQDAAKALEEVPGELNSANLMSGGGQPLLMQPGSGGGVGGGRGPALSLLGQGDSLSEKFYAAELRDSAVGRDTFDLLF